MSAQCAVRSAQCAVIVFATAPVAGFAKTRLMPALGAGGAARLAERMLVHAVQQAVAADLGPVELCAAPDTSHPVFARLAASLSVALETQGPGDLGARMDRAFTRHLVRTSVPTMAGALLIGTDAPGLVAAVLRRAAAALSGHGAVFVPALDGGYALVGLRQPAPWLFDRMGGSTAPVMADTRERLADHGMSVVELPPLADIDEPGDLVHLPQGWVD